MIDPNDLGPAPPPRPRQPARQPAPPRPAPQPDVQYLPMQLRTQAAPVPHWLIGGMAGLLVAMTFIAVFLLITRTAHSPDVPRPTPPSNGVALGHAFVPRLAAALADGFDAEADALEKGKTTGEANAALKEKFQESRDQAFFQHAGSLITDVVPSGKEPKDDAERRALVKVHRDFARGLRGARGADEP